MNFVLEDAIEQHEAGLQAELLEPELPVEAKGRMVGGVDTEIHLASAKLALCVGQSLPYERTSDPRTTSMWGDVYAPEVRFVRELRHRLSVDARDADKTCGVESSQDSTVVAWL